MYTGWSSDYLQGTLEHHCKKLVETLHWNANVENMTIAAYIGAPLAILEKPSHTQAHIVKQISIHASLKWQDGGTPVGKWTGLLKFRFHLEFTALQCILILLLKRASISCEYVLNMSTAIFCVYLGLQFKWNQFSSNNSHHTSCIHKALHTWKWPDLMPRVSEKFHFFVRSSCWARLGWHLGLLATKKIFRVKKIFLASGNRRQSSAIWSCRVPLC